jgi:hypothetical protein
MGFYGYFLPFLRGRTGLGKALNLSLLAAAVTVASILTTTSGIQGLRYAILAVAQVISFGMLMGFLADHKVLTDHRHPWAHLADIHNIRPAVTAGTSILIGVVTAVATTMLTGTLHPFFSEFTPPAPPETNQSPSTSSTP